MPVVASFTDQQLQDGVNYLLSGPAGLGQNFNGFSDYSLSWQTGNPRPPYSQLYITTFANGTSGNNSVIVQSNSGLVPGMVVLKDSTTGFGITAGTTIVTVGKQTSSGAIITLSNTNTADISNEMTFSPGTHPFIYTAPIAISTAEMLDQYTYKFTFTTPWVTPAGDTNRGPYPFTLGQPIQVNGVADTGYNQTYKPIGVVEVTSTYVIAKMDTPKTLASSTGGTVGLRYSLLPTDPNPQYLNWIHTDCFALATVFSPTDRVFINAQYKLQYQYISTTALPAGSSILSTQAINRYKLVASYTRDSVTQLNTVAARFIFDRTITLNQDQQGGLGPGASPGVTNNKGFQNPTPITFASVIDTPPPGLYAYFLDTAYNTLTGDAIVVKSSGQLRSLTTQVVKQ